MAPTESAADPRRLQHLVPLNSLSPENFLDLARKLRPERVSAGRVVFRPGERDNKAVYLLTGELELHAAEAATPRVLAGDTPEARHAVAHQQPRDTRAVARTDVELVRIDNDLLDLLLTWDQSAGYLVTELSEGGDADTGPAEGADWMTALLQSPIFHQVPPANIQTLFSRLEPVSVRAGDVIVRQGEPGDYYYVVREGRARVTRAAPDGGEATLAELDPGSGFGEDALIADAPRNASVTMLTDGGLMRLSKADFDTLLRAPVLQQVDMDAGRALAGSGARWLDVRVPEEHARDAIPGSENVPLAELRGRLPALDPGVVWLVYCDTGRRSAAAGYILSQAGFDVRVLAGGHHPGA